VILACGIPGVNYLEVEKFGKISRTKTKLIFAFINNDFWDMDKLIESENLKGKYTETFEISENGKDKMYCMIFNIDEFKNKNITDESLKKFIKYLKKIKYSV
jgi:hypothetical protein